MSILSLFIITSGAPNIGPPYDRIPPFEEIDTPPVPTEESPNPTYVRPLPKPQGPNRITLDPDCSFHNQGKDICESEV